jgi:hypothetical protein
MVEAPGEGVPWRTPPDGHVLAVTLPRDQTWRSRCTLPNPTIPRRGRGWPCLTFCGLALRVTLPSHAALASSRHVTLPCGQRARECGVSLSGGIDWTALTRHGQPRSSAEVASIGKWSQGGPPGRGGAAGPNIQEVRRLENSSHTAKSLQAASSRASPTTLLQKPNPPTCQRLPFRLIRSLREDARLAKTLVGRGRVFI